MRILAAILSLYILGLSLVPCADAGISPTSDVQHISQSHHDNHSNHLDLCSPFCVCHCCGTHVVEIDYAFLPSVSPRDTKVYENYFDRLTSGLPASILQPPQV